MSISNFRQELREIEGVSRVAELADGVLLIDGSETLLVVYGESYRTDHHSDDRLEVIEEEFDAADYLLISIEGAVLLLEGTINNFDVSYLPAHLGGVELDGIQSAVSSLITGTLERERLQMDYLSEDERYSVMELLEQVLAANLTTYYTPREVASLVANWVTAGDRTSVLDAACGSGELLTAAIDAIDEPTYSMGVDQNGLACAITETRVRERGITDWQIRTDNFFSILDEVSTDPQRSLDQYPSSDEERNPLPETGFDCVVAHPPEGRSPGKSEDRNNSNMRSHSRIEHQFVNAACQLLADSGRGCFVLPSHAVRNLRERVLPDGVVLKRLVKLPEITFPIVGVEPVIACVERTSGESEIGILNVTSFDNLDRVCGAVHSIAAAKTVDNVNAVSVHSDISTTTLRTLLDAPGAAPFFTGNLPTLEDVTERIARGMTTGHNQGFYFDEEQCADSGIDDRFFTPVIKSVPEENPITSEHIDYYLFDLREFIEENNLDARNIDEVLTALEPIDAKAAEHVEEKIAPVVRERHGLNGVLPRSISITNPDLVTGATTSEVTWYQIEVDADEVLYDNRVVGISCKETPSPDAIQTLLNTPLYQRLNKAQLPNFDADYVQVQTQPLRHLPVFIKQLSKETLDRLNALSPYGSQESRETARTIILEGVDSAYRPAISETYDSVSPLSTLTGYETQIEQLQAALDQIAEIDDRDTHLVDEEMISRLEETFRSAELFTSRERLVAELLAVYSEGRYWSFMGGTASQFEGMLQDYVESTGGRVDERETEEGNTRLEYRYRDADWKPLRLKVLLDDFFSGELLEVMQSVREQRNEIAHGRLLEDPELNADIILLSFFVFTYALLTEYNEYLGAEDASR
ncbi:N-6 DNA methylase [Halorubrum sp. AD140]|uniref:N-6 DNA methylase n=1 Tax=Halorubrum sp. AD140 TaxID=3050073 RepID=UPI002ACC4E01|nr:N-6 DNA methylase [Halorubrum sp. AD140]MDZ5810559.1 N-6 DNA methylase [Halorubrum sp. AD140]